MDSPIKIILTEDQEKWRRALRDLLHRHNIVVLAEASNGIELLQLLKTHKPDVVLLDLKMDGMDGNETMSYLSSIYPDIKVIIMSLFDDPTVMEDYALRDVKGYFSKCNVGASERELIDAIRKVHKGGKYFNYDREGQLIKLSVRQKEILNRIGASKTQEEIADELGITVSAVGKQKKKIMDILDVKNISQLYTTIFEKGFQFLRGPTRK